MFADATSWCPVHDRRRGVLSTVARVLATCLVLLLSGLPPLAAASDDAEDSTGARSRGKRREPASRESAERATAGELMEMSPEDRRAFFREAAPEVPLPANFGTDELDEAQAQLSQQYYQGMADTLRVMGQAAGTNAAALPPILKAPRLAAKAPVTLKAGKSFKEHFVSKRPLIEEALGIKIGRLKDGGGDELLKVLSEGIDSGLFQYVGQGTLKKGADVVNVYRGRGLTIVTKSNGEWVTALRTGEGLDLAIQMLP